MRRLYHFSDQGEIGVFHPRAPLAHPEERPAVYAIDEWHQPLYFFPRECPRIGVWPVAATTAADRATFTEMGSARMLLFADHSWKSRCEEASVWRYEFASDGFIDCEDHGCFVSYVPQTPISVTELKHLPNEILSAGCAVHFVDLLEESTRWLVPTTLHVSMVRMRNLDGWNAAPGSPVRPPNR